MSDTKPERILQVVTYMGRGGIETMLMNYYRNIDRTEVQFDFLVHRDFRADYDDEIEALGGRIFRISKLNPLSPAYRRTLRGFFEAHRYRVVHCHLNYMSGIVLREAKKAGAAVCIAHAHNTAAKKDLKYPLKKFYSHLIPKYADLRFACGKKAGEAIFSSDDFFVLPNAIDTRAFLPDDAKRSRVRSELKLSDKHVFIHVGRFNYQKNHEFLIDAFGEYAKRDENAVLLCVGDGELRPEIQKRIKEKDLEQQIRLLGVRSDVGDLLQAADIFLFPSIHEGLPVTMIEAQAAGLACIMSEQITDECILTDLVTALPITDTKCWADAMEKAVQSHTRRDHSAQIAAGGYDIVTAARKLENFYLNGEMI